MFHTKGLILKVFEIILGCYYCCSWGCPQVDGPNVGANKLLAMAKNINGLYPITIGKMFFRLINYSTNGLYPITISKMFFRLIICSIVLQLQRPFQEHLSPHQFGILTVGSYKAILFAIQTLLNIHLDWVVM
jgi:hypothetical protein